MERRQIREEPQPLNKQEIVSPPEENPKTDQLNRKRLIIEEAGNGASNKKARVSNTSPINSQTPKRRNSPNVSVKYFSLE